jgi:CRISPR/Cas system-associated exonuclease Cas4 (RecB family)
MLIDLNHNSGARYEIRPSLSAAVNAHIDEALLARHRLQMPRDYLGASRIGEACARRLAYEYAHVPEDPDKAFTGQTLRIFAAGHTFEDLTIEWMRAAGFELRTRRRDGGQFGFETAGGRIKGHIDGVIVGGPDVGVSWPALWEHKALKAKSWADVVKRGVELSKPVYYAQLQIYMAYMELETALFTCLNKDTQELHHERVDLVQHVAQALSDKAADIIRAVEAREFPPRIAASPDFYICKFCPFNSTCWETTS